MYPVEIAYLGEPTTDYIRMAVEVTWKINLQVRMVIRNSCAAFDSKEGGIKACSWRYSRIFDRPGRH